MRMRARHTLAVALAITLAGSATALAGGPLRGRTYQGASPSSGTDVEGHHKQLQPAGNIILRVSGNGRSVSIRFTGPYPILYCISEQQMHNQSTTPTTISGNGTFRATVHERYTPGAGESSIAQVITGRFSGRTVRGTIHTQAAECGGATSFSATTH